MVFAKFITDEDLFQLTLRQTQYLPSTCNMQQLSDVQAANMQCLNALQWWLLKSQICVNAPRAFRGEIIPNQISFHHMPSLPWYWLIKSVSQLLFEVNGRNIQHVNARRDNIKYLSRGRSSSWHCYGRGRFSFHVMNADIWFNLI